MGGDFGLRVTLPACIASLKKNPHLHILLTAEADAVHSRSIANRVPTQLASRLTIIPAGISVRMDEKPSTAIRQRRDSSMALALKLVAEQQAAACISAGNTGALMALGRLFLKMQPGIDRPAIITSVPTMHGHCYILDLGANVDCSAQHLLQFAVMGSVLVEVLEARCARVGLLNVGEEASKGNEQVKLANELIRQQSGLNYIGYIEGNDVFSGKADVVVCDGFVGNIALKSSEGLAKLIAKKVNRSFSKTLYRRLLGVLAYPVLQELHQQMDPSRRNGATLLGLQGIVLKSHGSADKHCFHYAIEQALSEVQHNIPARIRARLGGFSGID